MAKITGKNLDNVIDWDQVFMDQWRKNNPGAFQILMQTTISPKIGKMIITGTNPDDSTDFIKQLFLNDK